MHSLHVDRGLHHRYRRTPNCPNEAVIFPVCDAKQNPSMGAPVRLVNWHTRNHSYSVVSPSPGPGGRYIQHAQETKSRRATESLDLSTPRTARGRPIIDKTTYNRGLYYRPSESMGRAEFQKHLPNEMHRYPYAIARKPIPQSPPPSPCVFDRFENFTDAFKRYPTYANNVQQNYASPSPSIYYQRQVTSAHDYGWVGFEKPHTINVRPTQSYSHDQVDVVSPARLGNREETITDHQASPKTVKGKLNWESEYLENLWAFSKSIMGRLIVEERGDKANLEGVIEELEKHMASADSILETAYDAQTPTQVQLAKNECATCIATLQSVLLKAQTLLGGDDKESQNSSAFDQVPPLPRVEDAKESLIRHPGLMQPAATSKLLKNKACGRTPPVAASRTFLKNFRSTSATGMAPRAAVSYDSRDSEDSCTRKGIMTRVKPLDSSSGSALTNKTSNTATTKSSVTSASTNQEEVADAGKRKVVTPHPPKLLTTSRHKKSATVSMDGGAVDAHPKMRTKSPLNADAVTQLHTQKKFSEQKQVSNLETVCKMLKEKVSTLEYEMQKRDVSHSEVMLSLKEEHACQVGQMTETIASLQEQRSVEISDLNRSIQSMESQHSALVAESKANALKTEQTIKQKTDMEIELRFVKEQSILEQESIKQKLSAELEEVKIERVSVTTELQSEIATLSGRVDELTGLKNDADGKLQVEFQKFQQLSTNYTKEVEELRKVEADLKLMCVAEKDKVCSLKEQLSGWQKVMEEKDLAHDALTQKLNMIASQCEESEGNRAEIMKEMEEEQQKVFKAYEEVLAANQDRDAAETKIIEMLECLESSQKEVSNLKTKLMESTSVVASQQLEQEKQITICNKMVEDVRGAEFTIEALKKARGCIQS
eukprot:Platyproteum_vivax@DN4175_c0_g1_i1.p1